MIHIEGMGWLGSIVALSLAREGWAFTWNDTDSPLNAWQASTGAVYPAGDLRSLENHAMWLRWTLDGWLPPGTAVPAAYVYAHAKPPHEGKYGSVPVSGGLNRATVLGVAVDVPEIVRTARKRFAADRLDAAPAGVPRVVAHGFTDRLQAYMWGWSAPVQLRMPEDWSPELFTMLYGREHRFHMVYAYPIPSRPGWHWAGSALVRQGIPRSRPHMARAALERWLAVAPRLYPGLEVLAVEAPREGWRPRPAAEDPQMIVRTPDGWQMPPLWHSGVRWAPLLVEQLLTEVTRA